MIYNSRNFICLSDKGKGTIKAINLQQQKFYLSVRRIFSALARLHLQQQKFYLSVRRKSYDEALDIYNSRNFICLSDLAINTAIAGSTIVEILSVCQTILKRHRSSNLQQQKFYLSVRLSAFVKRVVYLQQQKFYLSVRRVGIGKGGDNLQQQKFYLSVRHLFRKESSLYIYNSRNFICLSDITQINSAHKKSTIVEILSVCQTRSRTNGNTNASTIVEILSVCQTPEEVAAFYTSTIVEILSVCQTEVGGISGHKSTIVEILSVCQTLPRRLGYLNLQQQKFYLSVRHLYVG